MTFTDTYISVDVETTGKIPGTHLLLSLGAVPIINGKMERGMGIYLPIEQEGHFIPAAEKGAVGPEWDPDTYKWWMSPEQKPAWDLLAPDLLNGYDYRLGAEIFYKWCLNLPGKKVFVADPAAFDAGFVWRFLYDGVGQYAIDNLGRMRMLDLRSLRMALFCVDYTQANRDMLPKLNTKETITHNALEDAICQGAQFEQILGMMKNKAGSSRIVPWND